MNDLAITYTPAKLAADFSALRAEVETAVAPYRGMVVTADDIPGAKKDRATLRGYKERIETERKRVKNEYLEPYNVFEAECKSVTAIIDAAVENIDAQIKAFEAEEKAAKMNRAREIYAEETPADVAELLPFEAVAVDNWANKTTSENAIRETIKAAVAKTQTEMQYIAGKGPEVVAFYRRTLNLMETMRYADELAAEKAKQTADPVDARVEEIRQAIAEPTILYTAKIACTASQMDEIMRHAAGLNVEISIADQISEEDF